MKVLITGGAGFIGSATAKELLRRDHEIAILDNFHEQVHTSDRSASSTWQSIKAEVELIEGDVRDAAVLALHVGRFEAILHLAAETGTGQSMYEISRYADVNVGGTAKLLQAIKNGRSRPSRIVVASSRSVYGEGAYECLEHGVQFPGARVESRLREGQFEPVCEICGQPLRCIPTSERSRLQPASVYAVTKLAQEQLCLAAADALGIAVVALRYQNVYGAGQSLSNPYTGILSIFSREILAHREIEVFEDGLESRDFVHVDDVARANAQFLEAAPSATGVVLNVGTGRSVSVLEVVEYLGKALEVTPRVRISGRYRTGDIRHNLADLTSLQRALGWTPQIDFQEGVRSFASWATEASSSVSSQTSGYGLSLGELENLGMLRRSARKTD